MSAGQVAGLVVLVLGAVLGVAAVLMLAYARGYRDGWEAHIARQVEAATRAREERL